MYERCSCWINAESRTWAGCHGDRRSINLEGLQLCPRPAKQRGCNHGSPTQLLPVWGLTRDSTYRRYYRLQGQASVMSCLWASHLTCLKDNTGNTASYSCVTTSFNMHNWYDMTKKKDLNHLSINRFVAFMWVGRWICLNWWGWSRGHICATTASPTSCSSATWTTSSARCVLEARQCEEICQKWVIVRHFVCHGW